MLLSGGEIETEVHVKMRAAAIVGLGSFAKHVQPFTDSADASWQFGLPASTRDADAVVIFGGTWAGKLPDPMPGLATGDSTFFFLWPLLILAAGVVGSIVGGRVVRSERRP